MRMIFHFNIRNIENLYFQLNLSTFFKIHILTRKFSILRNGLKVNEKYISKKISS
jgi:hypothetical protein